MPRAKLTKSAIDALPTPTSELVYWDETLPGFGVKVTPAGRKVFIVLYRTAGAGSRLRKYTIGPYGRVTLHVVRNEAQRVLVARTEGRDPATEKREARRRLVTDRVDDLVDAFIKQHVSKRRSAAEISRILKREIVERWGARSVHDVTRRDVIELVSDIVDRAPVAANKTLQIAKTFFSWCVGKALIDRSPCEGVKEPTREIPRDRVLSDDELARIIKAARQIGGPYGGIVEVLALTAQRREEVAQMSWDELDLQKQVWEIPSTRTKNGKPHIVHFSELAMRVLDARPRTGPYVFGSGDKKFRSFGHAKAKLDNEAGVSGWRLHDLRRTAVSGMARLGVPPHVADKILNHTAGTISGVAAVYQRHEFMGERKDALDRWLSDRSSRVLKPTGSGVVWRSSWEGAMKGRLTSFWVVAAFAMGAITTGFLQEIGKDAYGLAKRFIPNGPTAGDYYDAVASYQDAYFEDFTIPSGAGAQKAQN